MKYTPSLILRVILCFIPLSFFEFILKPLTIYLSYLLLLFFKPVVIDSSILIGDYNFRFISACIAIAAFYLLWILVMLTKDVDIRTRVKIIVTGFGLLLVMNVIRIAVLILLTIYFGFGAFEAVHLLWWKFMSGIYVAVIWIAVIRLFNIKSIPVYDDLRYLYSFTKKK